MNEIIDRMEFDVNQTTAEIALELEIIGINTSILYLVCCKFVTFNIFYSAPRIPHFIIEVGYYGC